jgi:hypothetical protein
MSEEPGSYHVRLYTATGTQREWRPSVSTFMQAKGIVTRWTRRTGGHAIAFRTVINSKLGRPCYSFRNQS